MITALVGRTSRRLIKSSATVKVATKAPNTSFSRGNAYATIRKSTTGVIPIFGTQSNNSSQNDPLTWMKTISGITAAGILLGSGTIDSENKTLCCGIVGVVGSDEYDAR